MAHQFVALSQVQGATPPEPIFSLTLQQWCAINGTQCIANLIKPHRLFDGFIFGDLMLKPPKRQIKIFVNISGYTVHEYRKYQLKKSEELPTSF